MSDSLLIQQIASGSERELNASTIGFSELTGSGTFTLSNEYTPISFTGCWYDSGYGYFPAGCAFTNGPGSYTVTPSGYGSTTVTWSTGTPNDRINTDPAPLVLGYMTCKWANLTFIRWRD